MFKSIFSITLYFPLKYCYQKEKKETHLCLWQWSILMLFLLVILSLINRPKCHASIKLQDLITKAVLVCGASLISYTVRNVTVEEFLTLHKSTFVRWAEILNEGCFGILCLACMTGAAVHFKAKRRNKDSLDLFLC